MKGKRKLNQLDVNLPQFQSQNKDLPDVEITSILTTLKALNPYLSVFITLVQMILKMHSIIYKYF